METMLSNQVQVFFSSVHLLEKAMQPSLSREGDCSSASRAKGATQRLSPRPARQRESRPWQHWTVNPVAFGGQDFSRCFSL